MGNKPPYTRNQQQSFQNGQTPDPAQIPAQSVAWPDDESRETVIRANQSGWLENDREARGHCDRSARLDAEIGDLNRQFEALRKKIGDKVDEKSRQDHYAAQRQRARDGFGLTLAAIGAPLPAPVDGVKVAPFGRDDPDPTGTQDRPDRCPVCGEPMQWTPDRGFVHQVRGGWEAAGELCQRQRRDAQADPQAAAS